MPFLVTATPQSELYHLKYAPMRITFLYTALGTRKSMALQNTTPTFANQVIPESPLLTTVSLSHISYIYSSHC